MSAAVFFQQDTLAVDDVYAKRSPSASIAQPHNLPPLAQIMPLNQQQLQQQPSSHPLQPHQLHQQHQHQHQQPHLQQPHLQQQPDMGYPVASNVYQGYSQLPDMVPQPTASTLYHLSVNNTPATTFTNANYIALTIMTPHVVQPQMAQQPLYSVQEKCTCKSNPNRIPRPRNAFILFRQKYHQLVLDELTEAKTNPEVSRELGRRWRALSPEERDHWNGLAEEEKKNHARKYPNYRYTPRRNGKNKSCPLCHKKALRQAQMSQQQQHMRQEELMRQDQDHMRQQDDAGQTLLQNLQRLPLATQQQYPQFQQPQPQATPQQPQQQYMSQMGQFVFSSPFQQMGQYGFEQQQQQSMHQPQVQQALEKVAYTEMVQQPQYMGYDQNHLHQQRFSLLPTPMTANAYNGYEVFMPPQPPKQ